MNASIDMSTTSSQEKNHGKWRGAIADTRRKIKALQATLDYYRKMEKQGEAWPLTQASDQNSGQQHSV